MQLVTASRLVDGTGAPVVEAAAVLVDDVGRLCYVGPLATLPSLAEPVTRVDLGYFITGSGASMSGGTRASLVGAITAPAFGFRDGRVQTERGAKRVRSFRVVPAGRAQIAGRASNPLKQP